MVTPQAMDLADSGPLHAEMLPGICCPGICIIAGSTQTERATPHRSFHVFGFEGVEENVAVGWCWDNHHTMSTSLNSMFLYVIMNVFAFPKGIVLIPNKTATIKLISLSTVDC